MPSVPVDGVELSYEERGGGDPVLLIHGTGGNVWDPLPGMLASAGHRVIAYDRRGFGASAHPAIKDPPRHTADAAALLQGLNAVPAIVVGHSMGGIIALDLAARHPDLVRALVLVEPPLHFKKHPSATMIRSLLVAQVIRRARGEQVAAERFFRFATSTTDGGNGYDLTPPDERAKLMANAPAVMRELDSGTGEHVTAADIAGIGCPVVCLVGTITLPDYRRAADRIVKARPATRLVTVEGAGHILPVSHPQAVVDAVREVTASDPAPAS
ncbi:MAG TPA: alpha/beta hydrolase [Thermoleophilaceae bacterium]|nr:alpha/beta hydrolase [Thermoleophilaceae bacterium]